MIDVNKTITTTLKTRLDEVRFLARNNDKEFKKLLYLIIIDYIYNWAVYVNEPQSIQKQLKELRMQYILRNCELNLQKYNTHTHVY